jgi:rod shape-determining protein MreC
MRNIFNFILRNNFWIIFLLMELVCLYLVFKHNRFHQSKFLNSANAISGKLFEGSAKIQSYIRLAEVNDYLAKENARLRGYARNSYFEILKNTNKVSDTLYNQKYEYIAGNIINATLNKRNNYFTVALGKKNGVEKDMAVITSNGIVGIVKDVSDHFCTVMSVLHKNFICNCRLKSDGNFGPLVWDGKNYNVLQLTDIPTHAKLKKGDTVVTSQLTQIFPEGITVGTVDTWERRQGEGFYTVNVKLSNDFKKLGTVYVVKYFYKQEQDSLEQASRKDDPRDN